MHVFYSFGWRMYKSDKRQKISENSSTASQEAALDPPQNGVCSVTIQNSLDTVPVPTIYSIN